jgi:hypothetical protein
LIVDRVSRRLSAPGEIWANGPCSISSIFFPGFVNSTVPAMR